MAYWPALSLISLYYPFINELAKKDKKIFLLVGDIGYGIFDDFRKNWFEKYGRCLNQRS